MSDRKVNNQIKKLHAKLTQMARTKYAGDDWHTTLLKGLEPGKLSPADVDMLNLMLEIPEGTMIEV